VIARHGLVVALLGLVAGCSALIGFEQPAERGVQCSDEVDNDGNGLMDCEEPSCADQCAAACGEGTGAAASVLDEGSGHCYLAFTAAQSAMASHMACMNLGGYLAVPDDPAEDALIRSIAPPAAALGIFDNNASAAFDFRQVTGFRPAQYVNFSLGQPDNFDEEVCVSYDGVAPTWQDNPCAAPRPYVCEVHPQTCGDLVAQPPEECDDGNAASGDGCAAACVDEDECALGTDTCHANADCMNQEWNPERLGYACMCRNGFVGNGFNCVAMPPPPVFQPLAPVTLTALSGCTTDVPRRGRKLAIDPFGALYLVVRCGGGSANVIVSVDGGVTWSPPQNLGANVDEVAVLGVAPGRAVVGMALANGDITVRQTHDFGMSWQPPQLVFSGVDLVPGLSLATDGGAVLVGLHPASGGYRVQRSTDPGLVNFTGADTTPVAFGDVLVNRQQPNQVFAVGDTGMIHVSESTDGGQSFGADVMPNAMQQLSDWAIGGGFIFAAGQRNDVARLSVSALTSPVVGTGLADAMGGERTIVAGDDGTAYVAYTGSVGVEVARWPSAQTVFDAPVIIEPMSDRISVEVVPGSLIAAVYLSLGSVRFAIVEPMVPP
jgi:cysteine-rich repeat protein